MKIHIIGASGSGKTYLAKRLATQYGISVTSLDDLFWDHSHGAYTAKRSAEERNAMLAQILQRDDWIIEGVQYSWCDTCFDTADIIYLLDTPRSLCRLRMVRRFIKRKLSRNNENPETLKSLIALLKWTEKFYHVNLIEISEKLAHYQNKVTVLHGRNDIKAILD